MIGVVAYAPNAPAARIGTDQAFFSVATFELLIGPGTLRVFCRSAPGSAHSPALAAPTFALLGGAASTPATVNALTTVTTVTAVMSNLRRPRLDVSNPLRGTISPPHEVVGSYGNSSLRSRTSPRLPSP
jgi:hypothetical protein